MLKALSAALISLLCLETGYASTIQVCGTTDRTRNYFAMNADLARSKSLAMKECRTKSANPEACVGPVCRGTSMRDKVSELPRSTQERLRAQRQATIARQGSETERTPGLREYDRMGSTSSHGVTTYRNGSSSTVSHGIIRYSDGRSCTTSHGRVQCTDGSSAMTSNGITYYSDGTSSKESNGNIYFSDGRMCTTSHGTMDCH